MQKFSMHKVNLNSGALALNFTQEARWGLSTFPAKPMACGCIHGGNLVMHPMAEGQAGAVGTMMKATEDRESYPPVVLHFESEDRIDSMINSLLRLKKEIALSNDVIHANQGLVNALGAIAKHKAALAEDAASAEAEAEQQ